MKKHIARNGIPKKQPNTVGMIPQQFVIPISFYIVQVGVDCCVGCGVSSIESTVHVAKNIMCIVTYYNHLMAIKYG